MGFLDTNESYVDEALDKRRAARDAVVGLNKVRTHGLRGRNSPMTSDHVTDEQKAEVLRLLDLVKTDDGTTHLVPPPFTPRMTTRFFEVRYSTYIGPGCAADHGDITVCLDGKIWMQVMRNGQSY